MSIGLYVHLPYCASRCAYCTFVVSTRRESMDRYLGTLEREIRGQVPVGGLETLYFGGGTPSQVPADRLDHLIESIRSHHGLQSGAEVSCEANPEDLDDQMLEAWLRAGINRISIGIQSFADGELAVLDRRHDAGRAMETARMLRASFASGSLRSWSLDLMLAIPDQDLASLDRSLDRLAELRPPHVSLYLLEMDKPHRLRALRKRAPGRFAGETEAGDLYLRVHERLTQVGYEHYEISNFALPGHRARHNTRYWQRQAVWAAGVAAHGHGGDERWANLADLGRFIDAVEAQGSALDWHRAMDSDEVLAEVAMLGLRLVDGVADEDLAAAASVFTDFARELERFIELDLVTRKAGRTLLKPEGWLLSDELFQHLV